MIAGIFHQGSGLGNQLHRYVATRVLALDKGYEWGMLVNNNDPFKEPNFKGANFMKGDFYGDNPVAKGWPNTFNHWTEKTDYYNPEFNFIEDKTVIDGEFQDERYWAHREKEVDEWLKVEPIDVPDDVCVIGFRGGEYSLYPDLFLTLDYWKHSVEMMQKINPNMKFEVHTDDIKCATLNLVNLNGFSLPIGTKFIYDIGINWRSMRYAKYAIIANSSFYILPRWLRNGVTIAPRYWARHNTKTWSMPQNYYSRFKYI